MKEERMGKDSILKLLVTFSLPAMIGMLVNAIYNVVDRMFIGNTADLGSLGLAGITICFPLMLVMMAFSLLVGVGGATCFSISLGAKRRKEAKEYQGNALLLTTVFALCFTLFGNLFMDPLLILLGASENVLPYAKDYLSIILFGAPFQCIAMYGNNFSRAQGNPKNAMISMIIGAGFNIIFDYLLIIQFGLGMKGAAFATIGGQCLSMLWQLSYLFSQRSLIPLTLSDLRFNKIYAIRIIKTGIPAFLLQIANSLFNVVINSTLMKYGGDVAVSTIGIITSFQTILLMPITGIAQGQQPLISYNYGAHKMDRVKLTLKYAVAGATIIAMGGFLLIQLFPVWIIKMFNQENAVITLGAVSIRIWFMMLPLLGAQMMCANFFQAVGKIRQASFLNLLRQVILLIPLVLLLSHQWGLFGIFFAIPCADMLAFLLTMYAIYHEIRSLY